MRFYEVGGAVRDELLGVSTKDVDYTVVLSHGEMPHLRMNGKMLGPTPFEVMEAKLTDMGFEVFVSSPQYLTVRARFPRDATQFGGRDIKGLTADFVLARKEGEYTDGRRPDEVTPGTLEDDLRRRDFSVNSLAKDAQGNIIDLFGGEADLKAGVLRAVGNAEARLREDALRALRAVRFAVTKALRPNDELEEALRSDWLPPLLASVSVERRREELLKAFKTDTLATLDLLRSCGPDFISATFTDGLWLQPSLRK